MFHLGQVLGEKWLRIWFSLATENLLFQRTTSVPVCPAPRAGSRVRGGDAQARREAAGRGWVFQLWGLESISLLSSVRRGHWTSPRAPADQVCSENPCVRMSICPSRTQGSLQADSELSRSSFLVPQETSEQVCRGFTEVCLQTPLQTKSSYRGS